MTHRLFREISAGPLCILDCYFKSFRRDICKLRWAYSIFGSVTARSRSGLWLQTTEDRERSRRQSEIPQILLQLVTLKPYP